MIVKDRQGHVRNTDKIWCIECCFRHDQYLDQSHYWYYYKSYKTFDAVVDAYSALQKQRGKNQIHRHYFRIANTNLTGYVPID